MVICLHEQDFRIYSDGGKGSIWLLSALPSPHLLVKMNNSVPIISCNSYSIPDRINFKTNCTKTSSFWLFPSSRKLILISFSVVTSYTHTFSRSTREYQFPFIKLDVPVCMWIHYVFHTSVSELTQPVHSNPSCQRLDATKKLKNRFLHSTHSLSGYGAPAPSP